MSKDDGGAAFPMTGSQPYQHDAGCGDTYTVNGGKGQTGMTLRDYFAAAAMNGIQQMMLAEIAADTIEIGANHSLRNAEMAYELADAMLKARDK